MTSNSWKRHLVWAQGLKRGTLNWTECGHCGTVCCISAFYYEVPFGNFARCSSRASLLPPAEVWHLACPSSPGKVVSSTGMPLQRDPRLHQGSWTQTAGWDEGPHFRPSPTLAVKTKADTPAKSPSHVAWISLCVCGFFTCCNMHIIFFILKKLSTEQGAWAQVRCP